MVQVVKALPMAPWHIGDSSNMDSTFILDKAPYYIQ